MSAAAPHPGCGGRAVIASAILPSRYGLVRKRFETLASASAPRLKEPVAARLA
jgi:hypothetical protein